MGQGISLNCAGRVPVGSVINEYLDVAHAFFHEQEPKLLNGVLNTLARQRRPDEF